MGSFIMGLLDLLRGETNIHNSGNVQNTTYEYCPRCNATLPLQIGYDKERPFWICKGCGEMLINPKIDAEDDIVWLCDGCGEMLNIQDGFNTSDGIWKCSCCGFENTIASSEIYVSENEFQADLNNPYRGLSEESILELSAYEEIGCMADREDIKLVENIETGILYVKKTLKSYNLSIYKYLMDNPINNMPRIIRLYESKTCLIVIEEYIEGRTLSNILNSEPFDIGSAVEITKKICIILNELHNRPNSIIHRDIKPSNIILTPENEVYLLDVNVAKWFNTEEVEDTRLFGTMYYAAPEQFGYGFSSSSAKSDVYALGILLNVMITGELPKHKRPEGKIWEIIERCISLEPEKRYTAGELLEVLESMEAE